VTNHKATTRQWSGIERFVRYGAYDSCIIELRDRVEALEASTAKGFQHIGETNKMVPDGSLVERVAYAITGDSDGPINWKPEPAPPSLPLPTGLLSKICASLQRG